MIASAGLKLAFLAFFGENSLPQSLGGVDFVAVGIFLGSFFTLRKFKYNPIFVMLGASAFGVLLYSL